MKNKHITLIALILLVSGCAKVYDVHAVVHQVEPSGLWSGLWHGFVSPLSILAEFLNTTRIAVYDINNVGFWYDLGFFSGCVISASIVWKYVKIGFFLLMTLAAVL